MIEFDSPKPPAETRVVVAMSGGVDSSVTAAALKEKGFDVIGVTLQLYDHGKTPGGSKTCCAGRDIHDARRVAEQLDIPHYVLDFEARFFETVMETFADAYLNGETPVPCVACNDTVKFGDLARRARSLDADALVTGHYVRRIMGGAGVELHCATDAARDQSYFLFSTPRDRLSFLHFPLGGLSKEETRAMAKRFGLSIAAKPDSQDICFVAGGKYADVVEKLRPGAARPGDIVDEAGRVLGGHRGIINFTVGQRRGIGVQAGGSNTEPVYVLRLESAENRVVVGPRRALERKRFALRAVNWLGAGDWPDDIPDGGLELSVRVRSAMAPVAATVFADSADGTGAKVVLGEPYAGVAPGQACVFYDSERLLGGGWIEK